MPYVSSDVKSRRGSCEMRSRTRTRAIVPRTAHSERMNDLRNVRIASCETLPRAFDFVNPFSREYDDRDDDTNRDDEQRLEIAASAVFLLPWVVRRFPLRIHCLLCRRL